MVFFERKKKWFPVASSIPAAVFLFLAFCFAVHPQSPLRTGDLIDPDDYMRLNQVVNWLSGQGWFDLSHPRLSPGDGTVLYWSRLADLPLAAVIAPLSLVMGLKQAAMSAALFVPPLLLGLFMIPLAAAMVRPLVPRRRALLATVLLLFAPAVVFQFAPGRVDHHGYQLLIAGYGFLCLTRLLVDPRSGRTAVGAALAFACSLWIGAEALPGIILFGSLLAFAAAWKGGALLRSGALFGFVLMAATALALAAARRPEAWGRMDITWFSSAYVVFAALLAGVFVFGWAVGRWTASRPLRLLLFTALGGFAVCLFFLFVPGALLGPYANADADSASLVLNNIGEAQPLYPGLKLNRFHLFRWPRTASVFFQTVFPALLALAAVARNVAVRKGRSRMLWIAAGAYLLAAFLMTLFWQVRAARFVQLFALAPLTWLLWRLWDRIGATMTGRKRFLAEMGAFGVVGLFPVVLIPAIVAASPIVPDVLLFPLPIPKQTCRFDAVAAVLSDPAGYGSRPRAVINVMNDGPRLLFLTPHNALAAPYNVPGNRDSFAFFSSRDGKQALTIVQKRGAELVLVCRHISPFYAGINKKSMLSASLEMDERGRLRVQSDKDRPALIERLVRNQPPAWLKRIELGPDSDYLLFEVDKNAVDKETKRL